MIAAGEQRCILTQVISLLMLRLLLRVLTPIQRALQNDVETCPKRFEQGTFEILEV